MEIETTKGRKKQGNEEMKKLSTFRFRRFPVYIDSLDFIREVKRFTKSNFPKSEQFGLTNQLWRALDSIVLNIAEGTDKYSNIEFSRFLNHSIGSLNEVVACLDLALKEKYIKQGKHEEFLQKADNLYRQLKALSSSIRNRFKIS